MSVINVKVKNIRPSYYTLSDWINNPQHEYIGRSEIVFINNLANIFLKQRKFDKAIELFKKSLKIQPQKKINKNRLASCLTYNNNIDEAIDYCKKEIEFDPENEYLYKLLSKNLMKKNCHREALRYLKKGTGFIEFNDNNISIITN